MASVNGSQFYGHIVGINSSGVVSITDTSVYGNCAGVQLGSNGSSIENTTISGNHGNTTFYCDGGTGLQIWNGWSQPITVTLNNVTIANNAGKGILVHNIYTTEEPINVVLGNSIVAANAGGNCSLSLANGNFSVSLASVGYNLDSENSCKLSATGDLTDTAPLLGPLTDDGSGTLTHALLPGSPAIDRGNPSPPGSGNYACATTDQRGVSRPQSGRCDIGAFELVPSVAFRQPTYLISKDTEVITLAVVLNTIPAVTTTVSYATSDGTALAGRDYISTVGTLVFPPGTLEEVIALHILNDPTNTTSRALTITLSNPSSFELGHPSLAFLIIAAKVSHIYMPIMLK
jgi:hypothetical protein